MHVQKSDKNENSFGSFCIFLNCLKKDLNVYTVRKSMEEVRGTENGLETISGLVSVCAKFHEWQF